MNQQHKDAIITNFVFLVRELPAKDMADIMHQKEIFTRDMMEKVQIQQIPSNEARKFLEIIVRRGPKAFNAFIQGLKELDRTDIIDRLIKKIKKLPPPTYEEAIKMLPPPPHEEVIKIPIKN